MRRPCLRRRDESGQLRCRQLSRRHQHTASQDDPAPRPPDAAAYFTDLGEEAAGEISRLWAQMRAQAGNPPGEDYLARVARVNALRKQAEEVVLADLILLPPEHTTPSSLTSQSSDRSVSRRAGPPVP